MIELERSIYFLINTRWSNEFFDRLMPLATNQEAGIFVLIGIVLAFAVLGGRKGRITAIGCVIAVALIDPVGGQILKPLLARLRPCHLGIGRLLVDCGSGYAMPSLHSANTFGIFTPIVWRYKWKATPLFLISIIVSYSRIYVGVHWPMDVLVGMALGILAGLLVSLVFFGIMDNVKTKKERPETEN